jgi:hypothetical protein
MCAKARLRGSTKGVVVQSIPEMIQILQANPYVLGLVEFGSNHSGSAFISGDYDLLVILARIEQNIRSLHFHAGQTPVDLNVRSISSLRQQHYLEGFDAVFARGRVIYDPTGEVAQQLGRLAQRSQTDRRPLATTRVAYVWREQQHFSGSTRTGRV